MASKASKKLFQTYPMLKKGVQEAQRDIFGQFPHVHVRSGYQKSKKALTGVYLDRYYTEPIDKTARKFIPGYLTELQERRTTKADSMRRKGKGAPTKGSGKKKKK